MPEPQDVRPEESSTTEQAVTSQVEETTTEQTATQEQETPQTAQSTVSPVVNPEEEVDERGVSYKNVAAEFQRKYNDVYGQLNEFKSNLPSMLQEAVREVIPQTPTAPKYTEEQLIEYKNKSEDPNARAWAEMELRRLDESKQEARSKRMFEEWDKKNRYANEQAQAFQMAQRKYPIMFNPDGSLNMNHPLAQATVRVYNSRPSFKQDGFGVVGAADMAFADYVLQNQPQLAQQAKQLKRQVKKLEKATLVEGSGVPQQQTGKSPLAKAKESLASKKYTTDKDIKDVAMEYLKSTNRL